MNDDGKPDIDIDVAMKLSVPRCGGSGNLEYTGLLLQLGRSFEMAYRSYALRTCNLEVPIDAGILSILVFVFSRVTQLRWPE